RIDEAPSATNPAGISSETVEYEQPVELVRVAGTNLNVTHRVNGWPAAMTMACGDGQLLITTLGPRAWMRRRPASAPRQPEALMQRDSEPLPTMANVANEVLRLREVELLPPSELAEPVQEYIGYSILSWWLIVGTLLGFSAVIVIVGVWLMTRGHLE